MRRTYGAPLHGAAARPSSPIGGAPRRSILSYSIRLYCIIYIIYIYIYTYYIISYYIISYYITLYSILLYCIMLYYVILYYIILYCNVLYYIVLVGDSPRLPKSRLEAILGTRLGDVLGSSSSFLRVGLPEAAANARSRRGRPEPPAPPLPLSRTVSFDGLTTRHASSHHLRDLPNIDLELR